MGCRLKGVCKVIYIPKEHPSIDTPSPCVRRQLAKVKGHKSGNEGYICGTRLSSGREDEMDFEKQNVCAPTRDQTQNLGILGQHSNQLNYPAKVKGLFLCPDIFS